MRNRSVSDKGPYKSNCIMCADIFSHMEPIGAEFACICIDCEDKPILQPLLTPGTKTDEIVTKEHQIEILAIYKLVTQAPGQDGCQYIVIIGDGRIFYCNEFGQCDIYGDGEKIVQIVVKK